MGASKNIPVRSVFPARIAATTAAGYASASETADVKFIRSSRNQPGGEPGFDFTPASGS